ncbi:MAG: SBBP repeat-containing protein [Bryobacteraceae bacterium]
MKHAAHWFISGALVLAPAVAQVRPLALSFSTLVGGSGDDSAYDVVVDSSGNAYVTGTTVPINAPQGSEDVFVAKVNPTGTAIVYHTVIGGSGKDTPSAIALDAAGNVYVAGTTTSRDFPTTPGAFRRTASGGAFVVKLAADGKSVVYSTYLGPGSAGGIAVDSAGHAYVSGWAYDPAFPVTPGAFQTAIKGANDAFVAKLNLDGSGLIYSTFLGSSGNDEASRIAVDASGSAYVSGGTRDADFPTTPGVFQPRKAGAGEDGFVSKLNPAGSALVYSTYLGGTSPDGGFAIAVDPAGAACVTGITMSADFPVTPGAFRSSIQGRNDAFVTKIDPDGRRLAYSTFLGGAQGSAIAASKAGEACLVGAPGSEGFPVTADSLFERAGIFVACLEVAGTGLRFGTYLGTESSGASGVALGADGGIYVAGHAMGHFPITPGAAQTIPNAGDPNAVRVGDAFLVKIVESSLPPNAVFSLPGASFFRYAPVAPASMVSTFGKDLAPRLELASTIPLPTVLAGTEVRVKDSAGVERLAPLISVSPDQVNCLVPEGSATGAATVTVTNGGRAAGSGPVQVEPVAPGIFTANANGKGVAAAVAVRVASDGTQTRQFVFDCAAGPGKCVSVPIDFGQMGDRVVILLFGTGIRGRSTLGAVRMVPFLEQFFEVQYAGPQSEYPGLDQVNLRIKARPDIPGDLPLQFFIDGRATNEVTIRIR